MGGLIPPMRILLGANVLKMTSAEWFLDVATLEVG